MVERGVRRSPRDKPTLRLQESGRVRAAPSPPGAAARSAREAEPVPPERAQFLSGAVPTELAPAILLGLAPPVLSGPSAEAASLVLPVPRARSRPGVVVRPRVEQAGSGPSTPPG